LQKQSEIVDEYFIKMRNRRQMMKGKCIARGICAGCKIYEDCRLPQALSRKQILIEKNNADKKK